MITEQDLLAEKPIVIRLTAQEIGFLYATKTSPYEFTQTLLTKLREVGGPVEGVIRQWLTHGQLCRIKNSIEGEGFFDYCWVPPCWAAAMNAQGGLDDGSPTGRRLEVV